MIKVLKLVEKSKKKDIIKNIILKKHQPIRMCIVCKNRFEKKVLHRFRVHMNKLDADFNSGRGIYLCENCAIGEEKILYKAFAKVCKKFEINSNTQDLKEMIFNGKD